MKITNLSIAAIAAVGMMSVANAEVTAEVAGGLKLYYETVDADGQDSTLFDQKIASGQAAVNVGLSGNLSDAFGYGFEYTGIDTLGLENNLVSGVRVPGRNADALDTVHYASKAFVTYKAGSTLAKVGRQHLDTPLAFTENWNIVPNSFDAAVLINSDIENVTLIGAYIGRANGNFGSVVAPGGDYSTFGTAAYRTHAGPVPLVGDGAYAAAALIKPAENAGINAWYYNVEKIADALWLDANYKLDASGTPITLGAIYAQMMTKNQTKTFEDTTGFAVKAGTKLAGIGLDIAYSSVADDRDAILPIANVATGFKKTKLPTAGVYNDGVIVAHPGSNAFKIKASAPVGPVTLAAQYITNKNDIHPGKEADEVDVIVGTKLGGLDVKALYINRSFNDNQKSGSFANSDHHNVRVILGHKF